MRALLIAALLLTATFASEASAAGAARSFIKPQIDGEPVAFCVSDGKRCGKPAADAWCRSNGYCDALLYQRAQAQGPEMQPLFVDTGTACTLDGCLSFREIKCWRAS
jgi:hypothetical protein